MLVDPRALRRARSDRCALSARARRVHRSFACATDAVQLPSASLRGWVDVVERLHCAARDYRHLELRPEVIWCQQWIRCETPKHITPAFVEGAHDFRRVLAEARV